MAENNNRTTKEAGYIVQQNNDGIMDGSWRNKIVDHSRDIVPEEDKQRMRAIINEGKGLTMDDLLDGLPEAHGPLASMSRAHTTNPNPNPNKYANVRPITKSYAEEEVLLENESTLECNWDIKEIKGKLANNKIIPIWRVYNTNTNELFPMNFRIKEAAEQTLSILNVSNNVNDVKVQTIVKLHERYVNLKKITMQLRESINNGKKELQPKLNQALTEIEVINRKFGI